MAIEVSMSSVVDPNSTEWSHLVERFQLTEENCDRQVSDSHLEDISRSFCSRWRSLHSYLELEDLVVRDIDREHKEEEEKRNDFFFAWKQKKGSHATYRKLICALLKIEYRNDAEKVCKLLMRPVSPQQASSSASNYQPSKPGSDAGM